MKYNLILNGGVRITFETLKNYPISTDNSKKQKIGIFIGGKTDYYSASSYIRLLSPLNELSDDFSICIIDNATHDSFFNDLQNGKNLDIIIIQRDIFDKTKLSVEFIKSLIIELKKNNITIIFDIDDDLLNIDKNHVEYAKYTKLNKILKFIINNSDMVTVSTNYLKNTLVQYNKNIILIPNTLMKVWDFNSNRTIKNLNSKKTIKIGYFGTRSHGQDIQLIETSFNNVKHKMKNKNIIFEIVGICYEKHDWVTEINIPNNYKDNPTFKDTMKNIIQQFLNKINLMHYQLPYTSFVKWMKNEITWDIAVAPLDDTNINASKSNLKYLEYTALNIPCIYSNLGPYKEIGAKNTGLVVNNTIEEWENAIITLIENDELYATLLSNAYKDVTNNYLVENATVIWNKILE